MACGQAARPPSSDPVWDKKPAKKRSSRDRSGRKPGKQPGASSASRSPPRGKLSKSDKESNAEISALRAPIKRMVAHFKNWKVLHTDYRRPYNTYRDAYDAARGLFFFSITWGFE